MRFITLETMTGLSDALSGGLPSYIISATEQGDDDRPPNHIHHDGDAPTAGFSEIIFTWPCSCRCPHSRSEWNEDAKINFAVDL